jgi:hypothetical protein
MEALIFVIAALAIAIAIWIAFGSTKLAKIEAARVEAMTPQERHEYAAMKVATAQIEEGKRQARSDEWNYGSVNLAMICPHCNTKGKIRTKSVVNKKGVSGGKATAAILTGGVSLLATGLSRKEDATQARCGNCTSLWSF